MKDESKKHLAFLSFTALALSMQATLAKAEGGHSGNGGNAQVCFDDPKIAVALANGSETLGRRIPDKDIPHIVSVETLDLVEAKRPKNFDMTPTEVISSLPGERPDAFATRIANRYHEVVIYSQRYRDISVQDVILTGKNIIGDEIAISQDASVLPAPDIHPLVLAKEGCIYATVAIQTDIGGGRRKLAIDGRLFNHKRNSDLSRGVMILHEYLLAAELVNHPDSAALTDTTGIQELVGTLIKKSSTLNDLIGTMKRRNIFPFNYGEADLMELINFPLAPNLWRGRILETYEKASAEFDRESEPMIQKFPVDEQTWARRFFGYPSDAGYLYHGVYDSTKVPAAYQDDFSHLETLRDSILVKYKLTIPDLWKDMEADRVSKAKEYDAILARRDPISANAKELLRRLKDFLLSDEYRPICVAEGNYKIDTYKIYLPAYIYLVWDRSTPLNP